ncbi:MAG: hypothetical protein Q7N50_14030, partial [Armatimonadota bacterium]|nr:hypothetical protein [Armatimonadota bacterium]
IQQKRGLRNGLLSAIGLGLLACLIASPWYIKSYIHTGNPVYPFLYNTFGGLNWNEHLADMYRQSQMRFGMGADFRSFILLPWDMAMSPGKYFDSDVLFASIGPVFLASLPMFAAVRFGRAKLRALLGFIAVGVVIWFFLTQQSRYLIPVMAIGAVAVGVLVEELRDLKLARYILIGAIGAGLIWASVINVVLAAKSAPGLVNPRAYLTDTLNIYPACEYVNKKLPKDAKILLITETRGFYLERDYQWGDAIHNTLIPYDEFDDPADMFRFLRSKGFTHVLINFSNKTWRQPERPEYLNLVAGAIRQGFFREEFHAKGRWSGAVVLYKLEGILLMDPALHNQHLLTHPLDRDSRK